MPSTVFLSDAPGMLGIPNILDFNGILDFHFEGVGHEIGKRYGSDYPFPLCRTYVSMLCVNFSYLRVFVRKLFIGRFSVIVLT